MIRHAPRPLPAASLAASLAVSLAVLLLAGCELLGPARPSPAPPAVIVTDEAPPPGDPADLRTATLTGDVLMLGVIFAGGCARHAWTLYANTRFTLSTPPVTTLTLVHDAGADRCEALLRETLHFDLGPALARWRRDATGPLLLEIVVEGQAAPPPRIPLTL